MIRGPAALAFPGTLLEMRNTRPHVKSDGSCTCSLRSTDLVSSTLGKDTEGLGVLDKNDVKRKTVIMMSKALRACLFERDSFCCFHSSSFK